MVNSMRVSLRLTNNDMTLQLGAVQLVFVSKFKTDITDHTMGISSRIITAPNAIISMTSTIVILCRSHFKSWNILKLHEPIWLSKDRNNHEDDLCCNKSA